MSDMIYELEDGLPATFVDFLGNEIHVGDTLVYATVSSHSAKLTGGRLLEFVTHDKGGTPYTSRRYDYTTRDSHEVFEFRLRVQPLLDSTSWGRYNDEKTGLPRPVYLSMGNTLIKTSLHNVNGLVED